MLDLGQRREFARRGASNMDATINAAIVAVEAQKVTEQAERIAAYEAKHAPYPFTDEQYKAARVVRTVFGWHKVVRVNEKSVSVETGYSWTDRIQRAKILEVRGDK
jgi:hypothetical protein